MILVLAGHGLLSRRIVVSKMRLNSKYLIGLLIIILVSVNGYAFGATQPGTVVVPVGESKIVDFSVQNGGGATEDVIATLSVVTGEDIVELIEDNEYLIPAGGERIAKVKVNVPRSANPDDKWGVKLAFRAEPVEPSVPSGMVSLGYGVDIRFDVVASEPVKETPPIPTAEVTRVSNNGVYVILVIAAIAIIIYFLMRKKKTVPKSIGKKRK